MDHAREWPGQRAEALTSRSIGDRAVLRQAPGMQPALKRLTIR
jgi:hypothetical protein